MTDLKPLLKATRTYRRFDESEKLQQSTLHALIDLARLAGSARNCQPWQYGVVTDPKLCEKIFPYLGWAGYLTEWKGPEPGERPGGYILCLLNRNWLKGSEKEAYFDLGIASQNLLLGATEAGLGGCRIGSFSPKVAELFDLPKHLSLELVIALGKPGENVILEDMAESDTIRYWRDEDGKHHVPKRTLDDIIVSLEPK